MHSLIILFRKAFTTSTLGQTLTTFSVSAPRFKKSFHRVLARPCMYQRVGRGWAEQRRAATGRFPGPYACEYVCVRARRANPARRLPTGGGAQREPRSQRPTCPRPHRPPAPALPLGAAARRSQWRGRCQPRPARRRAGEGCGPRGGREGGEES